jgi:hypothetical protein
MSLAKLIIRVEGGQEIPALFNPSKLVLSKSVSWKQQEAKERDVPELQFQNGQPRTLNLDLTFDTYDTPDVQKRSVREQYTDQLLQLAMVAGDKHRPPVCDLSWGTPAVFFKGVLEKLDQQFTLLWKTVHQCARRANARLRNGGRIQTTKCDRTRNLQILRRHAS